MSAVGLRAGSKPRVSLLPPLAAEIDPAYGRAAPGSIVVLLVDGLGWEAVRELGGVNSHGLPPNWAERATPITTVFPSTTTCALTSLSTAQSPSRHGVLGHRQFLPAWGTVADLLRMSPVSAPARDTLLPEGVDTSAIRGSPTLFELGLPATVLTRSSFEGSGFTRLLYAGARFRSYMTASDFAEELVAILGRSRPPPIVYAYWDELDTVLHRRGPSTALARLELDRLRSLLGVVAARLGTARSRKTQLWVTGDHGQAPVDPSRSIAVDRQPALMALLRHPPTGDRRAAYFSVQHRRTTALVRELRRILPAGSLIRSFEQVHREGWFGPPPDHPELRARTGDIVVVPSPPVGFTYQAPSGPTPFHGMRGSHGGLDRRELWVPWVAGTLAELSTG
ncbi:MAG: alkaline phosphatase family protein [Thermoplasmata archaeon]|nr:alkaline phosphatase family protein [Thermoplasmata archaeon]